ncbi:MAG TPA: hypothetical protein VJ692_16945 [Nitrospiraceae bacterium]|nr:hypothetical protein [Nitrospiraceae bacterium]
MKRVFLFSLFIVLTCVTGCGGLSYVGVSGGASYGAFGGYPYGPGPWGNPYFYPPYYGSRFSPFSYPPYPYFSPYAGPSFGYYGAYPRYRYGGARWRGPRWHRR